MSQGSQEGGRDILGPMFGIRKHPKTSKSEEADLDSLWNSEFMNVPKDPKNP
jgi:hypothetical protein